MPTVSAIAGSGSTVSGVATRHQALRVSIGDSLERIRTLMVTEAPYGFQERVSALMEWRKQRLSRELNHVEKLSVEAFIAEVVLHREEGRHEEADRLMAAINAGQPIKLRTDGAVVIRIDGGEMFLDLSS